MHRHRSRIVVTGWGVVTPLGSSIDVFWDSLVSGRSGVRPIRRFDASTFPTTFAAEVAEDLTAAAAVLPAPVQAVLERKDLLGWLAASEALRVAGLERRELGVRAGVAVGTERRCPDLLDRIARGADYDQPLDDIRHAPFALSAMLAAHYRLQGPAFNLSAACASGTQAIGVAFHRLRAGEVDVMVAGGCDSIVDPLMLTAFSRLGALSTRNDHPARASRPFDRQRDGFVIGEGAGMIVLERREHARARGAPILGEIVGYASSSNAYRVTDPPVNGDGTCLAMRWALADAGLHPEDIEYINAHGTSTGQNDISETNGIKQCFGSAAARIPISATKSMTGHLVCGSGAIEAVVCLLTMRHGQIHPTINYEEADPDCDLDYVPNVARQQPIATSLSNSCGFGGVNAALVMMAAS